MTNKTLEISIRAKKLAVLMRAARQKAKKSAQECADAINVPLEEYQAYELGEASPSLPQVELLAYVLNVPLEHFYGNGVDMSEQQAVPGYDPERLLHLRQRMVGVLLKQTRLEAGLSLEEVAERVSLSGEHLKGYELGEDPIPLPVLESLVRIYGGSVEDFQDRNGPVGEWIRHQNIVREIMELPPELQTFVCLPVNRPYIELAQRLSQMSVEKLRAVAEGLLEITL
jgi:transcriptional regulator with XRE-family HTH domain